MVVELKRVRKNVKVKRVKNARSHKRDDDDVVGL